MKKYIGLKEIYATPEIKDGEEGYKVIYQDGYESWSPKDVFEKSYREVTKTPFSVAHEAMMRGEWVSRSHWVKEHKFVYIEDFEDESKRRLVISYNEDLVENWFPGSIDILSEDWVIVKKPSNLKK